MFANAILLRKARLKNLLLLALSVLFSFFVANANDSVNRLFGLWVIISFFFLFIGTNENRLRKFMYLALVLLPFQFFPTLLVRIGLINISRELLRKFNYIDEFVFVFLIFCVLSYALIKSEKYKFAGLGIVDVMVVVFLWISTLSIIKNEIPPLQGIFGTYDLVKNILVIYIFSVLPFRRKDIIWIINLLKNVAIFLACTGIIQEFLALFMNLRIGFEAPRFGIYRVASLTGPNTQSYFGLYLILFLFLGLAIYSRPGRNFFFIIIISLALFFTVSRQAWLGLCAMLFFNFKGKLLKTIAIVVFLCLIILSFLLKIDLSFEAKTYYRLYAFNTANSIFVQHPFLGVGPGMFGGVGSIIFHSPVYKMYNWPAYFIESVNNMKSIDQFWPQVWAETGIFGILFFWGILFSIFWRLKKISKYFRGINDDTLANIGKVLSNYIFVILIMGVLAGLNMPFVVFIYFALAGIYFSYYRYSIYKPNEHSFNQ